MIIKRRSHVLSHLPASQQGQADTSSGSMENPAAKRRGGDRRRSYRRIEDKNLISKAYEEANAIRENAQQEGFEEGLRRSEAVIDELRNTIDHLLNIRAEGLLSVADEVAGIAMDVAGRILKTEVSCDESLVIELVRDTVQKIGHNSRTILVKVHPDDILPVKKSLKTDPLPHLQADVMVMEDSTVDRGSCLVETNNGLVDARFSTQLEILHRLMGKEGP